MNKASPHQTETACTPKAACSAGWVMKKRREKQEQPDVENRQRHVLDDVPVFEMPDLMREHGDQLVHGVIADQRVEHTIFFVAPNPVKNALAFVERFEPSMTKRPAIGNLFALPYSRMARRSSPSSSGVNLLNIGMMIAGAAYAITSMNTATVAQT